MSGGAPIPVVKDKDESPQEAKILSIADLEAEGSKKLPRLARGEFRALSVIFIDHSFGLHYSMRIKVTTNSFVLQEWR